MNTAPQPSALNAMRSAFLHAMKEAKNLVTPPPPRPDYYRDSDYWQHVTATIQNNRITAVWVNGWPCDSAQPWYDLERVRPDVIGDATLEASRTPSGRFPLGVIVRRV